MVCTFFGHRDTPNSIKNALKTEILSLVLLGVNEFYVGNNGNFDFLVQNALYEILQQGEKIRIGIVLSQITEKALGTHQELTVFPEELAGAPKRFAISKRNDYMLKKSDYVITYALCTATNALLWEQKAEKQGKKVIKLAK